MKSNLRPIPITLICLFLFLTGIVTGLASLLLTNSPAVDLPLDSNLLSVWKMWAPVSACLYLAGGYGLWKMRKWGAIAVFIVRLAYRFGVLAIGQPFSTGWFVGLAGDCVILAIIYAYYKLMD